MDLLILRGDIALKNVELRAANARYDEAIHLAGGDSAERSEISARAWLQKADCLHRLKDDRWKNAVDRSEQIWASLDEEYMVGFARWTRLKLEGRVPDTVIRRLEAISPAVAAEVIRLHEERQKTIDRRGVLAARAEITDRQLMELIRQATQNVEVRHREW